MLPRLSQILDISVDKLLGYISRDKQITIYEEEYKIPEYYWGVTPSKNCLRVLDLMPPSTHLKLLDIGCGEGKDSVFFARNGYDVTAFDVSNAGIEKTKRLADNVGVQVKVFKADILDFRLDTSFDIIFSSGVLHYIKQSFRPSSTRLRPMIYLIFLVSIKLKALLPYSYMRSKTLSFYNN